MNIFVVLLDLEEKLLFIDQHGWLSLVVRCYIEYFIITQPSRAILGAILRLCTEDWNGLELRVMVFFLPFPQHKSIIHNVSRAI